MHFLNFSPKTSVIRQCENSGLVQWTDQVSVTSEVPGSIPGCSSCDTLFVSHVSIRTSPPTMFDSKTNGTIRKLLDIILMNVHVSRFRQS
jgi:hypothetical protein